jgi:acyl carrier protein
VSADDPGPDPTLVRREQLPLPRPYVAPRTPTERKLNAIWCEVLTMDRIGIEDAYTDLGGDSFLASLIFTLIQDQFAISLPMSILVTSPTIAELAAKLDAFAAESEVR